MRKSLPGNACHPLSLRAVLILLASLAVFAPGLAAQTAHFSTTSVNFSSRQVGSASAVHSLVVTFDSAGTIQAPAVLTQGAPNLDFNDAGTGTCTTNGASHTYAQGDTCTVDVTFSPKYAGARYGAVVLKDASGDPIATAHLYGTGLAPQTVFGPAAITTLDGGFRYPTGVAADTSGNVYVADGGNNAVKEIPAGCPPSGCTPITLGGGFGDTTGVAVDGSGNIYVADDGNDAVKEIPAGCTSSACVISLGGGYESPFRVAVDSSGNIYVADGIKGVEEMPPGCASSACVTTLGGGFESPEGVAVDGDGNVYVADTGNRAVREMPPGCASSACVTTLGGGFFEPYDVAVDGNGNVYVVDSDYNIVTQMPAGCVSSSCVTTLGSGFSLPIGVGVDSGGNVYIADFEADAVKEIHRSSPPALTFATTNAGVTSTDSPKTVTVTNIGNRTLDIAGVTYPTDFPEDAGGAAGCSSSTTLLTGQSCTIGIDFSPVDASATSPSTPLAESVNLTDNDLNVSDAVQSIAVSGTQTGTTTPPTELAFGTPPATRIDAGGNAGFAITVDEVISGGAVSTTASDKITLTVAYPDDSMQTYTENASNGIATFDLSTVALSEAGTYTYTASATGLTSASATETVIASTGYYAPSTNVGRTSSVQEATLTLNSSFTLGTVGVLTRGVPNLDFQQAEGGTCAVGTKYAAGQKCTIKFIFKPTAPGARYGAVVLYDNASPASVAATTYLQGTGVGSQVVFGPPFEVDPIYVAVNSLSNIEGVAVDGGGNVYIADSWNGVEELPAGCASSACIKVVVPMSGVSHLALDGLGNVYVSVFGAVSEIPKGCASSACVKSIGSFPDESASRVGLAVDGTGNVYVADPDGKNEGTNNLGNVYEIPAGCTSSSCVKTLGNAINQPREIAVDPSGNLWVSSPVEFEQVPAGCTSSACTIYFGFIEGAGIAVNADGSVYLSTGPGLLLVIPPGCMSNACLTSLSGVGGPGALAVDGSGNLYIIEELTLNEVWRTAPPALTFATTVPGSKSSDSPQAVTVTNVGNADLTFPVPGTGTNPSIASGFTLDSATTCPQLTTSSTAATLAPAATCSYAVDFMPVTAGTDSGSLVLTDDSLNATYATQTISLTGTGTGIPPFGFIGHAVDATTGAVTVRQGDRLKVSGWAADPQDGAPVTHVSILIDGNPLGDATLGKAWPICASKYGSASLNCGWILWVPTASLSVGNHAVTAIAYDSLGLTSQLGSAHWITVAVNPVIGPPVGEINRAMDHTTISNTVAQSDSLFVSGWAASPYDGAPVAEVKVLIDGNGVGDATLGILRPGIAEEDNPAYLKSGWYFLSSASSLSLGTHKVTATAYDLRGQFTPLGTKTITVSATQLWGATIGHLDSAGNAVTRSFTVGPTDHLLVKGWALDPVDGAPVSNVSILIDGVPVGNATLGVRRGAVVKMLDDSRYLNAGWKFSYPGSSLSSGTHTVTAVATNSRGDFTTLGTAQIAAP